MPSFRCAAARAVLTLAALCVLVLAATGRAAPAGPPAAAGPVLPDTPAGRRGAALVAALRTGSTEAVRAFVAENYAGSALAQRSAEARAGALGPMLADLGRGELVDVQVLSDLGIGLVFKAESRAAWFVVTLQLEPAPPHGIVGARLQVEDQPPEHLAAGPPLTEAEALAAVGAEMARRAAAEEFSGVVMVARAGKSLLTRAAGLADRAFGVAVKPDTRLNLGSINKIFTQVVIRQLAEEGKLDLTDRLVRRLPDYPNREVAEKITLQQLLDHTSGLGDFFGERFTATPKERLRTLADYLPLFVDRPLLFTPGAERRYSNAGYLVLGLVIERLTGKTYFDAVRERVFRRAGMTRTDSYEADDPVPDVALGYTRHGDEAGAAAGSWRSNLYARPARGSSAGGGYSTAEDLLLFSQALREGRLVKSDVWRRSGGIAIAGGGPGCNAVLEDDWHGGYTVIVLSNLDPPSAESLASAARAFLARAAAPVTSSPERRSPAG